MTINADTVVARGKHLIYFNNQGANAAWTTRTHATFPNKGVEDFYSCQLNTNAANGLGLGFNASIENVGAKYINFQDQKTALAKADTVKVLASGGFSGCIFQLWRDPDGHAWGAHVYKGTDGCADINQQAKARGWTLLYSLDTKGKGAAGREIFVVAVVGDKNADVIAMRIHNGKSEKLVDWHTVYNWQQEHIAAIK
ncbi:hypothetical protein L1F30_03335 [Simiduia sp. 21SJ11W-1]|uniref:hypothetical protein n=1 Tax=Simiduia sp. 21SJ11W-1 TaxID=2909669 RepID=UPI00209FA4C9|nr:hypothetical protein [Simiduia sp. 21SJ11W-1]UTA48583.1 hypothetical protein L1F30_03335 [Simiduia sp. 21SJ11W-1]